MERCYSTCPNKKGELDPNWVTGFVDGEGCFSIIIEIKDISNWKVRASFEIDPCPSGVHSRDEGILYKIQDFFGVGKVYHRPSRSLSVFSPSGAG